MRGFLLLLLIVGRPVGGRPPRRRRRRRRAHFIFNQRQPRPLAPEPAPASASASRARQHQPRSPAIFGHSFIEIEGMHIDLALQIAPYCALANFHGIDPYVKDREKMAALFKTHNIDPQELCYFDDKAEVPIEIPGRHIASSTLTPPSAFSLWKLTPRLPVGFPLEFFRRLRRVRSTTLGECHLPSGRCGMRSSRGDSGRTFLTFSKTNGGFKKKTMKFFRCTSSSVNSRYSDSPYLHGARDVP